MIDQERAMTLLPPEALIRTGTVDHADWNYRPFLGAIIRMRCRYAVSLISARRFHRILEVGYGSGIFMPELSRHCDDLYGIDVHPLTEEIGDMLAKYQVTATLVTGDAALMPFEDNKFDCVVALSVLEFIADLPAACREIHRVLVPGGELIAVVPGHAPILDLGLRLLTGKSARTDYADRRQRVVPTLLEHFDVRRRRALPRFAGALVPLYTGLELGSRKPEFEHMRNLKTS